MRTLCTLLECLNVKSVAHWHCTGHWAKTDDCDSHLPSLRERVRVLHQRFQLALHGILQHIMTLRAHDKTCMGLRLETFLKIHKRTGGHFFSLFSPLSHRNRPNNRSQAPVKYFRHTITFALSLGTPTAHEPGTPQQRTVYPACLPE